MAYLQPLFLLIFPHTVEGVYRILFSMSHVISLALYFTVFREPVQLHRSFLDQVIHRIRTRVSFDSTVLLCKDVSAVLLSVHMYALLQLPSCAKLTSVNYIGHISLHYTSEPVQGIYISLSTYWRSCLHCKRAGLPVFPVEGLELLDEGIE